MLRKYSCDCIGFEAPDDKGERRAYCVWACDAPVDAPSVGMWERPGLLEKTSEPLTFARTAGLLKQIDRYIGDGYRFREVKSLLGLTRLERG